MRFGSPYSSGFGSPDNMVSYVTTSPAPDGTSVAVRFKPRSGWGDAVFGIYANAKLNRYVVARDGLETAPLRVPVPFGSTSVSILPLRMGHFADPGYEDSKVVRVIEQIENNRITLAFTFEPAVAEPLLNDSGYTSGWNLSGLVQGQNVKPVADHPRWGRLELALVVNGGVVTVNLSLRGKLISSGSATILGTPFQVTLLETNASGVSGSVTVSNAVTSVAGASLDIRWPQGMRIKRDTVDPPTTVLTTLPFAGTNSVRWTDPTPLAAGTYYYRVQPISDTGDIGTDSPSVTVIVPEVPAKPTSPFHLSGGASNTILGFTASVTPGATYRAYLATAIGGQINLNDIQATAGAGATQIALPAITGFPGVARVILRAVKNGIEERNGDVIELEYDAAGLFVAKRPNTPGVARKSISVTAGLTLNIKGAYTPAGQAAPAQDLQLFTRTPAGFYGGGPSDDYSTPDAVAALGQESNGIQTATLAFTFAQPGYYYARLLAATSGGVQSIPTDAPETLIYVSDVDLPAASNFSAELSRG